MINEEMAENILVHIEERSKEYLEETDIRVTESNIVKALSRQELKPQSVIIGIVGDINVSIIVSYDSLLLKKITEKFLEGEEQDVEMLESLAMEFANIVIANGISKIKNANSLVITTPLLIEEAKHLSSGKNSAMICSNIKTQYGSLLIQCIYPTYSVEKKRTVLVVDDSLIMRKKLFNYLQELGYDVVGTANDGQSAIHLTEKFNPDIITMDVTMPDISGVEAVREIRKTNSKVKILMVTANGRESDVLEAIVAGASSYLVKPIELDKLAKTIGELADTVV